MKIYEIWIPYFTLESQQQSAECKAAGESLPKRPKTQKSDIHEILVIDYLDKRNNIEKILYGIIGVIKVRNHGKTASNERKIYFFIWIMSRATSV